MRLGSTTGYDSVADLNLSQSLTLKAVFVAMPREVRGARSESGIAGEMERLAVNRP